MKLVRSDLYAKDDLWLELFYKDDDGNDFEIYDLKSILSESVDVSSVYVEITLNREKIFKEAGHLEHFKEKHAENEQLIQFLTQRRIIVPFCDLHTIVQPLEEIVWFKKDEGVLIGVRTNTEKIVFSKPTQSVLRGFYINK